MTALPDNRQKRAKLLRAAVATWLLLIGVGTVINQVALSRLTTRTDANAQGGKVAALETRVAELGQQIDQQRQRPAPLSQAQFDTERHAQEQRLSAIEQAVAARLTAESLSPLSARIDQVEARLARTRPTAPALGQTRKSQPKPSERTGPPFTVIGFELRGGERFLSILPAASAEASQTRVLRPSETEAGWTLASIDDQTALFQHNGQIHRIRVP
ncbi:hypothetical protein NRY95_05610 [Xanthomonas campestris pv. phormiicola]|nr:hypothetical protein [Xanthomonas campestris pv. phormiicola]UYC17440.1 hypothetical protein NRY95_05610 [Xanthomonas campestris pv. phormiicola]